MAGATHEPGAIGSIEVDGAGIRFRRNHRSRRNFKDLFAGKNRRARANEFWALRNVTFSVSPTDHCSTTL